MTYIVYYFVFFSIFVRNQHFEVMTSLILILIFSVVLFVVIPSLKKKGKDTTSKNTDTTTLSKKNIETLPELGLHFWGDETDEKEIMELWKKKDYDSLVFKWIDKYEESWDELEKGERVDYYKRKCYIYRKNYIVTSLMKERQQYEEIEYDLKDLEVHIYPCDNNCESECLIKEEQVVPFVDFYKNPTLPCCEDCPCRRIYHCDILVRTK